MAVPHVAGAAAIYLSTHPRASPAEVKSFLQSSATQGVLVEDDMLDGTPNALLYAGPLQRDETSDELLQTQNVPPAGPGNEPTSQAFASAYTSIAASVG